MGNNCVYVFLSTVSQASDNTPSALSTADGRGQDNILKWPFTADHYNRVTTADGVFARRSAQGHCKIGTAERPDVPPKS